MRRWGPFPFFLLPPPPPLPTPQTPSPSTSLSSPPPFPPPPDFLLPPSLRMCSSAGVRGYLCARWWVGGHWGRRRVAAAAMCVCVYWGRGFLPRVAGRRGAIQLGAGPAPWVAVACYRNRDPEASSAAVRAGNPGLVGAGSRARRSRPDAGLPQVVDVLFSGCADRACVGGCTLVDKRGQGFLRGPTQVSQARLVLRLHSASTRGGPAAHRGSVLGPQRRRDAFRLVRTNALGSHQILPAACRGPSRASPGSPRSKGCSCNETCRYKRYRLSIKPETPS